MKNAQAGIFEKARKTAKNEENPRKIAGFLVPIFLGRTPQGVRPKKIGLGKKRFFCHYTDFPEGTVTRFFFILLLG